MTSLDWYKAVMPEMFEKKDAKDWKPVRVNWEDSDNDTDEERERRIAELEALLFGK